MNEPQIKKLSDFEHARLRTAMYLGTPEVSSIDFPIYTDKVLKHQVLEYVPALLTAFKELLDNSLDELSFIGKGNIEVDYNEEKLEFRVKDDGRGIPFEYDETLGGRIATVAMSQPKVGRNFEERTQVTGQNGLGAAIVNFCSEWMKLTVWRNSEQFVQTFSAGDNELIIDECKITKVPKSYHGTEVQFKLDRRVFKKGTLPIAIVESLLTIIAATNSNIRIKFNGKLIRLRGNTAQTLFGSAVAKIEIPYEEESFDFYLSPSSSFKHFSMINNNLTYNGGEHLEAFKWQIQYHVLKALKRESNKRRLNPTKQDLMECMFIFANVRMNAPDYDGQAKTRLANPEAHKKIGTFLEEKFDWKKFVAENRTIIELMYDRCSARTGAKDQDAVNKKAKELKKKELPNLTDASSNNRTKCTLALFEGHSASASYSAVRNPDFQASMPLKGKVASTWNSTVRNALKSEAIDQICAAIGLAPGKKPTKEDLRYSQIQIYCDMDFDGFSISSTLIGLLFRFWPELFDPEWLKEFNENKPFVVLALTPLIILQNKKTKKPFYIYDEHGFQMSNFKTTHTFTGRAKGLGALSVEDFKHHVNDTDSKIAIFDDGHLEATLDIFFNHSRAHDRKSLLQGEITFETLEDAP